MTIGRSLCRKGVAFLLAALVALLCSASLAAAQVPPPATVLSLGRFMSEAQFKAFADQVQAAYNQIPNPDPKITNAVNGVTSTAGHGPVDAGAVDYLAKRLSAVLPPGDPAYAPLADASNQLSAAVAASENNRPIPFPTPFRTVTFGEPTPTISPIPTFLPTSTRPTATTATETVIQTSAITSWSTTLSGTATVSVPVTTMTLIVTTTRVANGNGGPTFGLPFQPTAVAQSNAVAGQRGMLLDGALANGIIASCLVGVGIIALVA
ncbi:hypothetical protein DFJ77DRAFT_543021 [Powellomyces hirtus]|nr:hypothetical protein DFJ77DRAFT_543021 [Powellomyces hirtus]